jgi:hypothetical protein
VADYTGTFNGSFTGSFTGDLVGVDYYDLENSPPTITPHQANQITANSNFRENFKANLNAQGLISSSAQVDYGSVSNIPSGIVSSSQQTKDYLPSGVVSSSQQTKDYLPSGVVSSSQQTIQNLPNGTISGSVQVDYGSISNIPNGIVSSSQQTKDYLPSGTISSSQQITITESQISDLVHYTDTDVKNKLNVEGVISSSQQIVADLPSGTISSSAQVDYGSISNIPSGIVSSSAQIVSNLVGQDVVVQSMSGSFSGSFEGDGSGLTNVPASGVIGLNLTRISTTNVTASVSEGTDSFKIVSGSTTQFAIKSGSGNISASGDLSIKGFPSVSESLSSAGKITYDTASGDTFDLTNIQVNDYDDNVAINFLNGKLTLTFGSPTEPSSLNASLSGFAVDRFNKVQDEYDVNGSWNNGGYTLISASLYEGSTLLEEVGTGTSLSFNTTTSGSHTYRLEYTSSSPLDGTLFKSSDTITGTLSKVEPTAPSIGRTYNVQLMSGNTIEEGATGSIAFTTSSGELNGWEYTGGSTSPSSSPITVSATGNVTIEATANYQSPTGDNDPQLTRTKTSTATSNRIRSLRYGASTATSFSESEIQDIDEWVNNIGTIDKGTINPNNEQFTINTNGEYIYIIYDSGQSDLSGILNVDNSNSNDKNVFTKTVVGNYKVYRSNNLSSTTILYKLTT